MICKKAKEIIKGFESLHDGDLSVIGLQPKMCPAGIWTVGYGHALENESKTRFLIGDKDKAAALKQYPALNEVQAEEILDKDLQRFEVAIDKLVKVPLHANQRGALVSLAFNIGIQAFNDSTLLALLNARDYKSAAQQFTRWNKCGGKALRGLTLRREAEQGLFLES
jgi:lysozyme